MIPFGTSVHWSAIVSLCSKDCKLQDRHSDVQAVACLPEVSSPWIVIHLLGNLIHTRKGMQYHCLLLHALHQLLVDDVLPPRLLILLHVFEAFFLDAGHVQDIHISRNLTQVINLPPRHTPAGQQLLDIISHAHHRGGHEVHLESGVERQHIRKRAHGATIQQVAHHADLDVVQPAHLALDGVHIQQCLGRVLSRSVTSIDDGDLGYIGSALSISLLEVPQHDAVCIAFYSPDCVLECLSLCS
mmetsp:Transcript_26005/g.70461  ORF Transcript_26005/g.70461 Transcript_26005/m.70461 type:complete len:243 (-) Transcript_26005:487-1215(-)